MSKLLIPIIFVLQVIGLMVQGAEPTEGKNPIEHRFKAVRPAIVWLGDPGYGHGTGFVVSRKYRLVATAAHVADHGTLIAVPEGSSTRYRIAKIWYHPAIVRELDEGLYAQSYDPRDGEVAYGAPDVAVLQLESEGPDLPAECALADDTVGGHLTDESVGLLGYPYWSKTNTPTKDRTAYAELGLGRILEEVDFSDNPKALPERRQWIRTSAHLGKGASGGPLVLVDGRVVGLFTRGGRTPDEDGNVSGSECFRIDCVREVIDYFGLAGRTATPHEGWGPDQSLPRLRQAVLYARRAEALRRQGDYRGAGEQCNEAIRLAPDYGWAYFRRSEVYLYYCRSYWQRLSVEDRTRFATWASDDARRCIDILPGWHQPNILKAQCQVYLGSSLKDRTLLRRNIRTLDGILRGELTGTDRAFAHSCRAQAWFFLGDLESALEDHNQAVTLEEKEPRWRYNRAEYWDARRRPDLAEQDRRTAKALEEVRANRSVSSQ